MKRSNRGGARMRSGPQKNNTSGLLGIWFRWAKRRKGRTVRHWIEVCAVVGERRVTRGLSKRTPRQALRELLQLRADAGLPVDTIGRALRAFHRWADHG